MCHPYNNKKQMFMHKNKKTKFGSLLSQFSVLLDNQDWNVKSRLNAFKVRCDFRFSSYFSIIESFFVWLDDIYGFMLQRIDNIILHTLYHHSSYLFLAYVILHRLVWSTYYHSSYRISLSLTLSFSLLFKIIKISWNF